MQRIIRKIRANRWLLAFELAALIIIGTFFLPGGDDLYNFYLPFAGGCLNCGFTPYYAQLLLAPLAWLPPGLAWPVLTTFTIAILFIVCRFAGTNPLWLLLSFPTLATLWLGQVDALIIAGLALALLSPNPWLRGVGLSLAAIKPQIAGLAIIVLLLHENWRTLPKVLTAPILVFITSLFIYGIDWPFRWLANASQVPAHAYKIDIVDPLPYILIPTLWFFKGKRRKFQAALFISTMASPYFGLYSYVVPLSFGIPGWGVLLSYVWIPAFMLGNTILRLAWIFPLSLLVNLYRQGRREVLPDTPMVPVPIEVEG